MIKDYLSEESKLERQKLKEAFEKDFNAMNWTEIMSDQEYIAEYSLQYSIFLSGYHLAKQMEK